MLKWGEMVDFHGLRNFLYEFVTSYLAKLSRKSYSKNLRHVLSLFLLDLEIL